MVKKWTKPISVPVRLLTSCMPAGSRPMKARVDGTTPFGASTRSQL
jgi:hypothetical protein